VRLSKHRSAIAEAEQATDHYAEIDEDLGHRFVGELSAALYEILAHPERFPRHHNNTHRLSLRNFPINIIYRVHGDVVRVIAIAHMKRDPAYWHARQ
jgi:toxin ParE1/3/4